MNKKIITYDESLKNEILSIFNKGVDGENFIVEKDTNLRVLTPEGEEVKLGEFAGISKGSEVFIKSDIRSLIKHAKS